MPKSSSMKKLLVVLAILLGARFIIVPLLTWQTERIDANAVKSRQVEKITRLIESGDKTSGNIELLHAEVKLLKRAMVRNTGSVQLTLQQFITNTFKAQGMSVTSFQWVSDERVQPIRTLSARVRFSGTVPAMMTTFLLLSSANRVLKVVEWDQRFVQGRPGTLGTTRGSVVIQIPVLETLVVSAEVVPVDGSAEKSDGR